MSSCDFMTACDYIDCQHNTARSPNLKRYGNSCVRTSCLFNTNTVNWVLSSSAEDAARYISNLTDAELQYCLNREPTKRNRKTVISKLQAEARRRGRREKS